jgi:signal transduction histidine kinase
MLYEFITLHREEIITRCRAKVATRSIPPPTETEINHGVPLFLDQLVALLESGGTSTLEIDASAGQHGHDLLVKGFTISQVVHDYGDVCQTITELAGESNAPISSDDFRTLNRCLDDAIASAVTVFERESQKSDAVKATDRENERMGYLVHEMRNLVNTAIIAFEVLKTGNVGVSGSTGAVVNRTLTSLRDLIARTVDEVRTKGVGQNKKRITVAAFIDEFGASARLQASVQGLAMNICAVPPELVIEADQRVLTAVLGNLLQNAFKFTRPRTMVTLRVRSSADRVLFDVQDECGGLPGETEAAELSATFEQRGADRTAMGIGLTFSRWGAEASGGRLYARNLPGKGCVFTLDLPRCSVSAAVAV